MGLLDDAIREHLELKRLHGASDEEISQQEAEALGPARRDFPQPAAEEEQGEQAEGAVEDVVPEAAEDLPTAVEPQPEPQPEPEREPHDSEPEAEDAPQPDEQAEASDEDVLEETPEF